MRALFHRSFRRKAQPRKFVPCRVVEHPLPERAKGESRERLFRLRPNRARRSGESGFRRGEGASGSHTGESLRKRRCGRSSGREESPEYDRPEGRRRLCIICRKPSDEMICGACADKVRADAVEKKRWEEKGKP